MGFYMEQAPFLKQTEYKEGILDLLAYNKEHETPVPFKGKDGKDLCGFFSFKGEDRLCGV